MDKSAIHRWQEHNIRDSMKHRRVTLVAGPRQCGKTTLVKSLTTSNNIEYRTLDDNTLLEAALADPLQFVSHHHDTLIIDEIQKAPELLPAIKQVVDTNNKKGQFILTGSSNLNAMPTTKESLAGRIAKIRLRPLTYSEQKTTTPRFFEHVLSGNFNNLPDSLTKPQIIDVALKGGYFEAMQLSGRERRKWYKDYTETLIEKDLKDISNIQKHDVMYQMLEICAAWSSKYMDITSIGKNLSLTRPTVESYINALDMLYLVERLPAWNKTDYSRVGKKPKLFMTDTGLMRTMLKWNHDTLEFDQDKSGKLIESFVYNELISQIDFHHHDFSIYHYRDREKREIDFIIENFESDIIGIEVKAGSAVNASDFKHLRWFKDNAAKDRNFTGIILHTGPHPLSFSNNMYALPMSALWV